MPIILASAIAAWFSFGAAPTYRSTASLWVDNSPSIPSSLVGARQAPAGQLAVTSDPSETSEGPAALEQDVVSELLLTPTFDQVVVRGSLLPGFLESGRSAAGFSPAVLLAGSAGSLPPSDAQASAAVSLVGNTAGVARGPQVLELSYDGPSPAVSRSVLESLIKELGAAHTAFGQNIGKTASTYYQQKLAVATSLAAGNQGSLSAYQRAHPDATAENDSTLAALADESRLANAKRADVAAANQQAETEAQSNNANATVKAIDPPTLPAAPVSDLPSKAEGLLGGIFAGLVVSLLALIGLTPRAPIRWDAEVPFFARLAAWDRSGRRRRTPSAARAARAGQQLPDPPQGA